MGRVLFLVWCGRVAWRAPFRLLRVFRRFRLFCCWFLFVCFRLPRFLSVAWWAGWVVYCEAVVCASCGACSVAVY